jgi:general secretion pathway protein I
MKACAGFTLIEVLVALAIVAIALVAGLQASAALTNNARRQSDVMLAQICAENELARLKLAQHQQPLPPLGDSDEPCAQVGQAFTVHLKVVATPNPSFRRVDAQVFESGLPLLRVSTVIGRY